MSHAAQLAEFRPALRARLQQRPNLLNPQAKVSVLNLAFQDCDDINLSLVEDLTGEELLAIIKQVASANSMPTSLSLTLPNIRDLTASTLKQVVNTVPVASLDLADTAIDLKALLEIIGTSKVEQFLCPALYKRAFDLNSSSGSEGFGGTCTPNTPSSIFPNGEGTPFPLAQIIYARQYRSSSYPRLHSGGLNWERVLHTVGPNANLGGTSSRTVDDRVPNMLVMPLQDALLSSKSIVSVVPKMLKQCLQLPEKDFKPSGFSKGISAIALTLTMAMADDLKTHPILADAFAAYKTFFCSSDNVAPLIQTSKPGSWSLLVFHECTSPKEVGTVGPQPQPEVRYAFYDTLATDATQVVDAEGFFMKTCSQKDVADLSEKWQVSLKKLEAYAEPEDEERRGHRQKGRVLSASSAEVHSGLKLVKRYNEQVKEAAGNGMK